MAGGRTRCRLGKRVDRTGGAAASRVSGDGDVSLDHADDPRFVRTDGGVCAANEDPAANQGLYNGFLAAGLVWSLVAPAPLGRTLAFFFLGCVVVAGVFGAFTAKMSILFIQALPAVLALVAVILS